MYLILRVEEFRIRPQRRVARVALQAWPFRMFVVAVVAVVVVAVVVCMPDSHYQAATYSCCRKIIVIASLAKG